MKKFGLCLIISGAVLILLSAGLTVYSNLSYQKILSSFETTDVSTLQTSLEQIKDDADKDIITSNMLGIIEIPSIKLKFPILEGTSDDILKQAVGHFPESSLPDKGGNTTLIGHNNFILSEPFKKLDETAVGDSVSITTKDKTYTYTVTEKKIVKPSNTDIVAQSDESKLTLVTCTDNANERLVVECILQA